MTEQFANNATSTLNGTITNVQTTLVVASATLFPSVGTFRIIIDSEIMLVTGVSGTTFTVTRGVENTVQTTHNNGATVTQILTSGALQQFENDILNVSATANTYANRPSPGTSGRIYSPTNHFLSYIDTGAAWQAYGPIYAITPPPAANDPGWTWVNQSGATVSQSNDSLYFTLPGESNVFTYYMRATTGSSTASIESASFSEHFLSTTSGNAQFPFRGVAMLESSTGKGIVLAHGINTSNTAYQYYIYLNNITGSAGTSQTQGSLQQNNWNLDPIGITFLRLRLSGSNVIAEYSKTRTNWTNIATLPISTYFTTGPNQMGLEFGGFSTLGSNFNVFHMVQT